MGQLNTYNPIYESCVMMIMEDSELSKIEYDLKAMMYSVYDISQRLCNISGNYPATQITTQ